MLESLEKLREYKPRGYSYEVKNHMMAIADEIEAEIAEREAEIAERYTEWPVSADGVPIHVGDETDQGLVLELTYSGSWYVELLVHETGNQILREPADLTVNYVKTDPVKELLSDAIPSLVVITEKQDYDGYGVEVSLNEKKLNEWLEEHRDELRKAVNHD